MQLILGLFPGPGASINAVPVPLMPLLRFQMPARSATVALGAAQLYLVDAPAGLAASALK